MRTQATILCAIFVFLILAFNALYVRATRKRGRRVDPLDIVPQWGGVLVVLGSALAQGTAAELPLYVAGFGLFLYGGCGHFVARVARRHPTKIRALTARLPGDKQS